MFFLRDLPRYETLATFARRYPDMDIEAVDAFLWLMRVGADFMEALDRYLGDHGLSQGRWITLVLLMREKDGTSSASELAAKAGVTRATMTGLLDGLERDALIERIPSVRDRRSNRIHLTAAGERCLDEVMPGYYRLISRLMRPLDTAGRRTLADILRQITQVDAVPRNGAADQTASV